MTHEPFRALLESKSLGHAKVLKLSATEQISRLPRYELEVRFDHLDVDVASLPGMSVGIVVMRGDEEHKRSHGTIVSVEEVCDAALQEHPTFRLVVLPRASRLALIQTQEVFLDRSVPEILKEKLARVGIGERDVDLRLLGQYPKREIVVQYQETDLAFVSRLAEHVGISFFFEHGEGRDRLVFTDHAGGFEPIGGNFEIPFEPVIRKPAVSRLTSRYEMVPATYAVSDYNYRAPHVDLTAVHESPTGSAGGVVEYGTHHKTPSEGAELAKIRAEEREAQGRFHVGEGMVPGLLAGKTFTLTGHPNLEKGVPLLVVDVSHELTEPLDGKWNNYRNTFRVTDARAAYRPPRITPRPRIHGVVTAQIEPRPDGAVGRIASLDHQGRYTVKFAFDSLPVGERQRSSHWVRMIHEHVGPNYGMHMPLKAGVEVLVTFIDGDPDRPLIVGAVHNPLTPSPVDARDPQVHRTKTASGIEIVMRDEF